MRCMNINRYSIGWLSSVLIVVGLLTVGIIASINLEGFCKMSSCYPHQIQYIGFGNVLSIQMAGLTIPFIFIGMLFAWLEEQKRVKENAK